MLATVIVLLGIATNAIQGQVLDSKNVSIEMAPYQVSVRYNGISLFIGNIISKRMVLSANYGFYSSGAASDYSIAYGSATFGGEENFISVKEILRYINKSLYTNDVALLRLVSDIPFSATAKPIPLASNSPAVGTPVTVTGWSFSHDIATLRQDSVQIADISACRGYFPKSVTVDENSLCATAKANGDGVCTYTSGSSMVSNGELIGTSAIGRGCDNKNYYGTFANVAVYKQWIDSHTNDDWKLYKRKDSYSVFVE